jgi:glycosyltransferase involved in cell wall biosynthesis
MDTTVRLSVIIATWNRATSLVEALLSVARSELSSDISWEILIVDNNSTDDTKAVCQKFVAQNPARYRYLFEKTQGQSSALNTGIDNARGEIIAFTDDDVTVDRYWLAETLKIYETFPCIGTGGKIVDAWTSAKPDWLSLDGPYQLMAAIVRFDRGDKPCGLATPPYGANLSVKREAFQKYGKFRADLGPTGGSEIRGGDTEFCWRLLRAGEKIMYAPRAIVFHPVTENRISRRYFQEWYYAFGQAEARMERAPEPTVRYFGFPRYLLRTCINDLLSWMTAFSAKRRFFYKLQLFITLGRMMEDKRLWQSGTSRDTSPI